MEFASLTQGSTWAIAAAAFSNPMYLSARLGATGNTQSTGFDISACSSLVVAFEGTYTGAVVQHEQTLDPQGLGGWFAVAGASNIGAAPTAGGSTSGVAYTFGTEGVRHRIKVTALVSGTLEARISLSTSQGAYLSLSEPVDYATAANQATEIAYLLDIKTAVESTDPVPVKGGTAADAALTLPPVTTGGLAATALPTAVTAADVVNTLHTKYGEVVAVGALRLTKGRQLATLTASTAETTLITAGAAGIFNDVYGILVTNTSATATKIVVRDATGGTSFMTISAPANDTRGFMLEVSSAIPQATAANNWTVQAADSVSSLLVTALYVARG